MPVIGGSRHSDAGGLASVDEPQSRAERIGSLYLLSTRRTAPARGDCHLRLTNRAESVVNGVGKPWEVGNDSVDRVAMTPRSCRAPWLSRWSMFTHSPPL
jgi:hypothetical protein